MAASAACASPLSTILGHTPPQGARRSSRWITVRALRAGIRRLFPRGWARPSESVG